LNNSIKEGKTMLTKRKAIGILGVFIVLALFSTQAMAQPSPTHIITVTQGVNGKITPITASNEFVVAEGLNKLFTITPSAHYYVESISIDGLSIDPLITGPIASGSGTLTIPTGISKVYKFNFTGVADDHTITATYVKDTFDLTVDKTTLSSGEGTVSGTTIDCGLLCSETVDWNSRVTLTPAPTAGSIFEGWVGCTSVNKTVSPNTCDVLVTKAKTVKAKFTKTYTLTVNVNGTGGGTVKGIPGINCGTDCTETFKFPLPPASPKVITLTATPGTGSSLTRWAGSHTATTNPKVIKVTMDGDKDITVDIDSLGMKIAEKVSVVDTTPGTGLKATKIRRLGVWAPPEGSDYEKDETQVWVSERSAEAFSEINQILCMIGQTQYNAMVNKGNYKAQIDTNLCSSNKDDPSAQGQGSQNQSSGATAPSYEMWTVNSSRVDNNSPQIVKAWIHEPADDNSMEPGRAIFAKVVITEPSSETNPYGIFTVNWAMYPEIDGTVYTQMRMGKGILKTEEVTGEVLFKFVSEDDFCLPDEFDFRQCQKDPETQEEIRFTYRQKATLDRAVDGSTGGGTAYKYEDHPYLQGEPEAETFDFAFDPANFLRAEKDVVTGDVIGDPICLNRTDFDETAWRYGLYDSDGARINRNSSFSVKVTKNAKTYYGSVGYYGYWFPKEVTLNNNDLVYKMEFGPGSGTGEPYNVLIADGKLKKHVRKEMTLGAIKNVPLDYWDMNESKNYRVKWDGTNFMKVEWLNQAGNYMWEKVDPPVAYDISSLSYDTLFFYSQSLGGNVQIKLTCAGEPPTFSCTASDDLAVVFYAESIVFPGDTVPASFACFNNCPDVGLIGQGNLSPYDNTYQQVQQVLPSEANYVPYSFDGVNMVLKSGANPVVATSNVYQFGVMSGPLFDPTVPANLNYLACDWNANFTCGWQAWNNLPEYYTWETGPNSWNKFTALVKDGVPLKFDPPLQVSYVHTWIDLTTSTFNLDYSGFGNLWGIPGKCINWDTGEEVNCGPDTRWIPQFSIAEGSQVTDVSDGTTTYYVKPLEMEQRMKEDAEGCVGLVTTPYTLPDISEWQDPAIGAEPVVSGSPAVIGGVLQ
jgi:hypothetical protein